MFSFEPNTICGLACPLACPLTCPLDDARTRTQMPEEFNFDPDIMELKEEIKAMQQEFIELHKNSDAIKSLNKCGARAEPGAGREKGVAAELPSWWRGVGRVFVWMCVCDCVCGGGVHQQEGAAGCRLAMTNTSATLRGCRRLPPPDTLPGA